MKYKYFENEWEDRPDWIANAKSTVENAWRSEYKPNYTNTNEILLLPVASARVPSTQPTTPATTPLSSALPQLGDLPDWKKKKRQRLI